MGESDEKRDELKRDEVLKRMLRMPPKPHQQPKSDKKKVPPEEKEEVRK